MGSFGVIYKVPGKATAGLILSLALIACRTGRNYPASQEPRFAGDRPDTSSIVASRPDTLRLASFNIEFSLQVDSAIAVLASSPVLRGADVLLLQEMNEKATARIAAALGLGYVYYPAIYHFRTQQNVGNAVLSRWPIVEDKKLVLPHVSRFVHTQRTATAATIRVGRSTVRVYSTHLGTMGDLAPAARREQLRAILADAEQYPHVVIGGDMNDASVGQIARAEGYLWPTEHGPPTTRLGRLDHILLKGFAVPDSAATGTVHDIGSASDHLPVWALAILP